MVMIRRPDAATFADRDVRFTPSDPSRSRTLRSVQVERYNRDGFISGVDVFDADEAAATRSYIDELLATVTQMGAGRDSYSVNSFHPVCAGLWDLATEPRILELVRDILGSEVVCWGTHLFAKLPGDGKEVPFHQDAVYWPFTPSHSTTVWLAIDDVTHDNAPVRFIPGSHLLGAIPHDDLESDGSRVLDRRATGAALAVEPVANVLRAGQVSLHSDLLLHGSVANTSEHRRAGLTLRYASASVRTLPGFEEWTWNAVHVLDGDPTNHWPDTPRPEGESPDAAEERWRRAGRQAPDAS